jgi:hypothetical protein
VCSAWSVYWAIITFILLISEADLRKVIRQMRWNGMKVYKIAKLGWCVYLSSNSRVMRLIFSSTQQKHIISLAGFIV